MATARTYRVNRGRIALAVLAMSCAALAAPAGAQAQSGISGTVFDGATPATGACVAAFDPNDASIPGGLRGFTTVAADGTYFIAQSTPGDYKVTFASPQNGCGSGPISIQQEWYADKASHATADLVHVDGTNATGPINAQVVINTQSAISGTVFDGSQAAAGACVAAFDPNDASIPGGVRGITTVAGDGTYSIPLAAAGDYKVTFASPQGGCGSGSISVVQEWYTDKTSHATADLVHVNAGQNHAGINAEVTVNGGAGNLPPTCPESHAFVETGSSVVLRANCLDPELDPLTYGLSHDPDVQHGTIDEFTPTSVRYHPTGTYTGDDELGYFADDPFNAPVNFSVKIKVLPVGAPCCESAPEATPADPYAVSVDSPVDGPIYLDTRATTSSGADHGFTYLDQEFDITAPDATDADDPLKFVFKLDAAELAASGVAPAAVRMLRNGDPINSSCPAVGARTNPDWWPCVQSRQVQADGDLWVTVLTMQASVWNVGVSSAPAPAVTALAPVHGWIGLKNSDDQGTQFDVMAELLKNGTPVASGLKRCVTGVTRNPSLATEAVVPWDAFENVPTSPGDTLSLRLSTRIGTNPNNTKCAGPGGSRSSAVGLRLYYDSATRPSAFGATIVPDPSQALYLHSNGNACANNESTGVTNRLLDFTAPSAASAKCKDSAAVKFAGGNAWTAIGTWSLAPLP